MKKRRRKRKGDSGIQREERRMTEVERGREKVGKEKERK